MYVLDTKTLIYFFKGMGNVASNLLNTSPKEIGIPAVVLYELEYGIAKSTLPEKRLQQLQSITSVVQILPFRSEEVKITAMLRANLEKNGTTIGPHDLMIAGTALSHQGTLVTHNTREFQRIGKLKLKDWF